MTTMLQRRDDLRRLDYLLRFTWRCATNRPDCDGRPHPGHNHPHARPNQLAPDGDWWAWFLMSGRGFGKTRSGAEFVKEKALETPDTRVAIIAPTFAKARDACIEGESGLRGLHDGQGCIPWERISLWNRSMGELYLTNGSQFKIFSGEDVKSADLIRGYQCHYAWFEELAAMPAQDHAWAMMEFALRLGADPRAVITSTPRPTPLVKKLNEDTDVVFTHGSTYDNRNNLPARQLARLEKKYAGTLLGQQELHGKLLLEAIGALWQLGWIRRSAGNEYVRTVVAVDPAGSHKPESDETGIVACGMDAEGKLYVLQDISGRYTPDEWAKLAVSLYDELGADAIVGEVNYGGEMVRSQIRHAAPRCNFRAVRAKVGKKLRAEPVVALYERQLVTHVGIFEELELQQTAWIPPGRFDQDGEPIAPSKESPDRMDALVYALTELALKPVPKRGGMRYVDA